VVGYGMAALLCRAFWPASRPSPALGVPGIAIYLWLGLAMSGPVVLLRRRPPSTDSAATGVEPTSAQSYTWAELAWMLIGIYWIVVSLIVIPARLSEFKLGDMILFGLVPLAVALGMRLLRPIPKENLDAARAWTHAVGVTLLVTWPIAWICLIVLGKTLP
jgi:apolipoprotein N-acyltransferase